MGHEALIGWYRSTNAAVRSKGTLYLALHQHGTYAWGRWVGMSYDGPVVSGWGAIARTEETDDVEAEVQRLEALGATRYDHQQERGFDFWVMRDPWGNEFCVLQPNFPLLLSGAGHGPAGACLQCHSSYSTLAAMVA